LINYSIPLLDAKYQPVIGDLIMTSSRSRTKEMLLVGFLGNIAEWYDFSVYAYFAIAIGQVFFGTSNVTTALIQAFFVFSMSFLIRPFGSVFFGYIADKFGRGKSLKMSLLVMAIPTVLIGVLPTYKEWGLVATFLLIILRLIQGFAAGGELPVSACYLYEASANYKNKRGFFCSFVIVSSLLGTFLGSFIAYILNILMAKKAMLTWGWRVPFLVGFIMFFVILWIRKNVMVKDAIKDNGKKENLFRELLKYKMSVISVVGLYAFLQTSLYILFIWMPSYLRVFVNVSGSIGLFGSSIGLFVLAICTLLFGYLSDYIRPRTLIIFSVISISILAYPLFLLLSQHHSMIVWVQLIFALCLGAIDGVVILVIGGLFKSNVRCLGMSVGSTFSSSIFGGLAPTLCNYVINRTGNVMFPVFLLVVVGIIALPIALNVERLQRRINN
jgi:MFS transporter, MHS family, proline/betaine transporter